jgi:hypothetical protein
MNAADLATSLGGAVGGRIIGGLRSGAILLAVRGKVMEVSRRVVGGEIEICLRKLIYV